jgi:hypothetical protein
VFRTDVRIYDIYKGVGSKIYANIVEESEEITIFKLGPKFTTFLITNNFGIMKHFNYENGMLLHKITKHTHEINNIFVDNRNKLISSFGADSKV